MKIHAKDFRVRPGRRVRLKKWPTDLAPLYPSAKAYEKLLEEGVAELSALQQRFYASPRHALLLIFQGMDAAGKDGVISHVMSGINPQGCSVFSFKEPSREELAHDFLWRTTRCLPERGRIGIFNRSYYEEVLVVRVHPELLQAEGLPPETLSAQTFWRDRYHSITAFEKHLERNGTRVLKFFLHLSREEQRRRFLARIDRPEKNWKLGVADIKERKRWPDYQEAYQDCLEATSTDGAPWHVIPADDKKNARLIVSGIIREELRGLQPAFPRVSRARHRELRAIRQALTK
jgi:PPK2 family polyphosphate:nucleotide phosphotransferase